MNASVQLKLDRIAIDRLCRLGYLHQQDRDPTSIRLAAAAALAAHLASNPEALVRDGHG